MPRPLHAAELVAAAPVWLLELTFAGRAFRFSSELVDISDADSNVLSYEGALGEVEFDEGFDLFSEAPSLPSVSFEVFFPAGVSVAALVGQGHALDGAKGELSLHLPGNAYEDRSIRIQGTLSEPVYGDSGEPVAFSLESLPFEDGAQWPPAGAVVSETTWPDRDPQAEGLYYPTIIGKPGIFGASALSATPALFVDDPAASATNLFLVAGHHVTATSIKINDIDSGDTKVVSVVNSTDNLGREIARIDLDDGDPAPNAVLGHTYYAKWTEGGGGVVNYTGDGPLEGAGDVIRWLLERSTLDVDVGRTIAAADLVNGYKLAGYIDTAVSPYAYLQQVLELVPVSMASGPGGIYPIAWRLDAGSADAVEALEAGPRLSRESGVGYGSTEIANEIRIEYAYWLSRDYHRGQLTLTGDEVDGTDPDIFSTVYSRTSQSRYGKRSKTITTDLVYERATAAAILKWQARAFGLPSRTVTYSADLSLGWLERGDVVTLTDPEISLSSQVCLVQAIQWSGNSLSLTLTLIEDPPRDAKL